MGRTYEVIAQGLSDDHYLKAAHHEANGHRPWFVALEIQFATEDEARAFYAKVAAICPPSRLTEPPK